MLTFYDWLAIGIFCGLSILVGVFFSHRASKDGSEGYFAAGRNLPWWAIAISNSATYQSSNASFVALIFAAGIAYNWVWWGSWVIWMPLVALIWAPMWRRMRILTTAELITLRYGGKPAKLARKIYSLTSFTIAIFVIAYITGFFAQVISPFLPWSEFQILLIFGTITLIYTFFGGLSGVVYVDVLQFIVLLIASTVFLFFAIDQHGGWHEIIQRVNIARPAGMAANPPTSNMPLVLLFAIVIQGFFFAGSPTAGEGMTAQRFMAARSERHAICGQLFNAFIALSLRMLPLIGISIVAMSMYWASGLNETQTATPNGFTLIKDPVYSWALLVKSCNLPSGFVGVLVAAEIAAFMSTLSSLINWGSSFVVNDWYKSFKKDVTEKEEVIIGKVTTIFMFIIAGTIAVMFVRNIVTWFMFINVAMVTFLLPLAFFRFFWWRFNVWGELAAVVLGLPVSIIVWFILGLKDADLISQGWGLVTVLAVSFILLTIISLLTPAEKDVTLINFYKKCIPPGFWGKYKNYPEIIEARKKIPSPKKLILQSITGIFTCICLCIFTGNIFNGNIIISITSLCIAVVAGVLLILSIKNYE